MPKHTHTLADTRTSAAAVFVNKFGTFLCLAALPRAALQQIHVANFVNFRIVNFPISSWPCWAASPPLLTRHRLMNVFASHTGRTRVIFHMPSGRGRGSQKQRGRR